MMWKEISLTCLQKNLDELENFLLNQGACSITYQDAHNQPILEPQAGENPIWDKVVLVALFTEEYNLDNISQKINSNFLSKYIIDNIHQREFADEEWERICMADFKPMQFGPRLWVYPSWIKPENLTINQVNIILDPGMAFGTGTHQTTSLCLNWLDQNITGHEHVTDFGCGSGILGVAAKKLGAQSVTAIDNDPQAIIATRDNALKNEITDCFETYLPKDVPRTLSSDILIANILAGILIQLSPTITNHIKVGGKIALSGILRDQVSDVITAYEKNFNLDTPIYKDEWALLSGTRK